MGSHMGYGDRVRDLLGDPDNAIATVILDNETQRLGEPCPYHLPMERKIERIGSALAFLGDGIDDIKGALHGLRENNGIQMRDITVLKTKAAIYGVVAAVTVSPFAVGGALLLFRRYLGI